MLDGITIYQLTESGLALRASVRLTKYWKDTGLNYVVHVYQVITRSSTGFCMSESSLLSQY